MLRFAWNGLEEEVESGRKEEVKDEGRQQKRRRMEEWTIHSQQSMIGGIVVF